MANQYKYSVLCSLKLNRWHTTIPKIMITYEFKTDYHQFVATLRGIRTEVSCEQHCCEILRNIYRKTPAMEPSF